MIPVSGPDGFDPRVVLGRLRDTGYRRVLIEGGGITVSRFVRPASSIACMSPWRRCSWAPGGLR